MAEQERRKKKVLITQGAAALLDEAGVLETYVKRSGAEVEEAKSGVEALAVINAESPDVVILDIRPQGINGPDIARNMQADPMNRLIPVIFVARAEEEHLEMFCAEAGGRAFLKPPYKLAQLLESTSKALGIAMRRDKRVDVKMKVDSQHFKKGYAGESIDVSLSGICVGLKSCQLENGFPVILEFWPPNLDHGIRSRGVVRRIFYRDSEKRYEVGIEFKDMHPKYQSILKQFLDGQG